MNARYHVHAITGHFHKLSSYSHEQLEPFRSYFLNQLDCVYEALLMSLFDLLRKILPLLLSLFFANHEFQWRTFQSTWRSKPRLTHIVRVYHVAMFALKLVLA